MQAKRPPLPADAVAAREWPALRARLIDVAASLDRLDHCGRPEALGARQTAEEVLALLLDAGQADRAERVLTHLSRGYDPAWRERFASGERAADTPIESSSVDPQEEA